jgi:hypothetical protein
MISAIGAKDRKEIHIPQLKNTPTFHPSARSPGNSALCVGKFPDGVNKRVSRTESRSVSVYVTRERTREGGQMEGVPCVQVARDRVDTGPISKSTWRSIYVCVVSFVRLDAQVQSDRLFFGKFKVADS